MQTLNKEVGSGRQDVVYRETLEHMCESGIIEKVRIEIKSDSYDFQCYARVSVFHNYQWNKIESIHYSRMATEKGLVYRPNLLPNEGDFNTDRNRLVKLAKDVLN